MLDLYSANFLCLLWFFYESSQWLGLHRHKGEGSLMIYQISYQRSEWVQNAWSALQTSLVKMPTVQHWWRSWSRQRASSSWALTMKSQFDLFLVRMRDIFKSPTFCVVGMMITTALSYLSHSQVWALQQGSLLHISGKTNRAKKN